MTTNLFRGCLPVRMLIVGLLAFSAIIGRGEPDVRFALETGPEKLVNDAAAFERFAREIGAEVERLLGEPAAVDDRTTLGLLLATRVHLAHYFAEDGKAVATAAWIRTRQTDPAGRLYAGLTTFAAVEARKRVPGKPTGDPAYRQAFFAAFSQRLEELPRTAEMTAHLRGQRERLAAISQEGLLRDVRETIVPALARRGYCGLAEADQLVRVRHRLVNILPVQAEILRALDETLAQR